MKDHKKIKGYIALVSAIIMAAILVSMTFAVSVSGYFARFDELNREQKQQSLALAQGCGQIGLLKISQGDFSAGTISIGSQNCRILSISADNPAPGQITITAQATVGETDTTLQTVIQASDFFIVSSQELDSS